MRWAVIAAALLGVASALDAQQVRVEAFGVSVTDRADDPTGVPAADGFGFGAAATAQFGRVVIEGRGHTASLSGADGALKRNVGQIDLRARIGVISVLAVEAAVLGRSYDPDLEGTDVGMFSAGIRSDFPIAGRGSVWGRVAYAPVASFRGGGSASFAMEAGLGFALSIVGDRVLLTGQYGFQRIDRELHPTLALEVESTSVIQVDVVQLGAAIRFNGPWAAATRESR